MKDKDLKEARKRILVEKKALKVAYGDLCNQALALFSNMILSG